MVGATVSKPYEVPPGPPGSFAHALRQAATEPSVARELAALRAEIAALRAELLPASAVLVTGRQAIDEFNQLRSKP